MSKTFFEENGYAVIDLYDSQVVLRIRAELQKRLRQMTGYADITLETYHQFPIDDATHTNIQDVLTEYIRSESHLQQVVVDNAKVFEPLVGPDMNVQSKPYLRITRPGKSKDNIGFHRDTFYGGSAHEVSVIIPFVPLDEGNALKVEAGSHKRPETEIHLIQTKSEEVEKGSKKHNLGFLYAPKVIDPNTKLSMKPIPLSLGQVLAFSLATLHGTEGNDSNTTRWSVDMRIVNRFAPVDLSARPTYYMPLSTSQATSVADEYAKTNEGGANPISVVGSAAVAPTSSQTKEEEKWFGFKTLLGKEQVTFGPYFSYQMKHSPRHILYSLSYHKFAAKMIGAHKRILDVGCSEGLGTMFLAEGAQYVLGIDIDGPAIESAKHNFTSQVVEFRKADMLTERFPEKFDAAVNFDVIEHIYPEHAITFIDRIADSLNPQGIAIIGTPNIAGDRFASQTTRAGHVNLYDADRLRKEMARRFNNVFIFSVNDEIVHTGFTPMAHYLLAMGVGPK